MIVRTREDHVQALEDACNALSRIMLSSAYNSHHDPLFKDVVNFQDFSNTETKIFQWMIECKKRLKEENKNITDKEILAEVYAYAKENSGDESTQNAAFLVNDDHCIVARSANGLPYKLEYKPERLVRPAKYQYFEHAERNVIYEAAKAGIKTNGLTMYVPWYSCTDCARAIIQAGIKKVVGHKKIMDATPERWTESIDVALNMLKEAGVECVFYEGDITDKEDISIMFNDTNFKP